VDLQYGDEAELRATLEDISRGGLLITVPQSMEIGQSFQTAIGTVDGPCSLVLRARVVHQEPVAFGPVQMYRVGLQFEHPPEALRQRIDAMLQELATAGGCAPAA
jgi:Tfp pilus assembly protein PilZ